MPNRRTHQIAGGGAGSILAGIWSAHMTDNLHPTTAAGCILGGLLGAAIPDSVDPPNSPKHRGTGHSIALASIISGGCLKTLPELILYAREEQRVINAYIHQGYQSPLVNVFRLHVALLTIGIIAGIPAGLISHLVLDSESPDGIRLLNKHY